MQHVIWDWNGTLLDDIHVVVDAVNETVSPYGVPTLSVEDHARLFARPVSIFYERMLERPITAREWRELDDTFHDAYARRMPDAVLSEGANELLESLHENGTSQSLLSMAPHHHVTERAAVFGVARYMVRIDGLRDGSGALKEGSMLSHLHALLAHPSAPDDPSNYVVIGDSVDDAVAARANGVPAVMFASGSHARADLVATGFPVADSLAEAIEVARTGLIATSIPRTRSTLPSMTQRPPDMGQLMKQAQKMQEQLAAAQADLASREFQGSAGGGVVTATVKGSGEVLAVNIDPSVIDPDDAEMLGDLVVAAVNSALHSVSEVAAEQMGGLTGGLDLGGLLG